MRRMAGGDTYLIIYLKMQLKAMKHDGILRWTGLEDNFADELALDLDEKPEDVQLCLAYLLSCGLAETDNSIEYFFPYAVANVGSEGSSAQRVRDFRARQALQNNADVTPVKRLCNGEIETIDRDNSNRKSRAFAPPTLEDVSAYCRERNNNVDAQRFIDYYTANGWKVGKNAMKDWRAAVRTWEREKGTMKLAQGMTRSTAFTGDDAARLEAMLETGD